MNTSTTAAIESILGKQDEGACLLGNEAIVRGALEAGVAFATGYPGTPSSEVTDTFARLAPDLGIPFEYSVNEKVCIEMAFAASLAGARSICAMKHLGLMVGGDPMSTIPYVGVRAGMVIVSAGDPSCRTSPNEQDQRHLGPMLHIPVLDPSTPQEAHALTRFAFELSEECELPVLLRVTTRVCHTRAVIDLGPLREPSVKGFVRDPARNVPIPVNARRMRIEVKARLARAQELIIQEQLFCGDANGDTVILATGAPAATCHDLLRERGLLGDVGLWTLSAPFPLPEGPLLEALRSVRRVVILEELSPFIEDTVASLCARNGLDVQILGKRSGHFPEEFEYDPAVIERGLHDAIGIGSPPPEPATALHSVPRPPSLCPGCPHRSAYFAARVAFDEDQLFFNDIGCYTLGFGPPLNTADALLCMGAGFSLAAGVSKVTGQRTVGFLGDSTFFHAGMPALLNAIKERANMVAVILDNQVTAMTGFQTSPTSLGQESNPASIEAVVWGLGAKQVETVDPYDLQSTISAFQRAKNGTGVNVIIVKRACPVHEARRGGTPYGRDAYEVDATHCRACGREGAGMRCNLDTTHSYERHLAHSRALQPRGATDAPPQVAPCARQCPLSLCIQGYAGNIAAGEYANALEEILNRTPLPETVCRVCHRPCEDACIRADLDEPIAINDLKRFVVGWAAQQEPYPFVPAMEEDNGKRVAVVGAGPAGLAAAYDLRRRGYGVTLYDARQEPGGLLAYGIPEYRLSHEALRRDVERIFAAGVDFEGGKALGRDIHVSELLENGFDSVFLALGAQRGGSLDLPGEGPECVDALRYLEVAREGGNHYAKKRVVVIGGGNAAIDAARTARRLGGQGTRIVCIESRDEMPALADEIAAAEEEGTTIETSSKPVRLVPEGIVIGSVSGDGAERTVETDLVILAIGQRVDPEPFWGELGLEMTESGILRVDPDTCATSNPRVFGGGDLVVAIDRTVTGAIAWGQRAAWGIDKSLRGREQADRRPPPTRLSRLRLVESTPPGERPREWRIEPPKRPPQVRARDFGEVNLELSEAQARKEASRCLACGWCGSCRACIDLLGCPAFLEVDGQTVIEPLLCNGCGVCADMCPNGAIRPVRGEA